MNTRLVLLGLLVCVMQAHGQHSPLTSQYLFNGLLINPAYAGSRDALAANMTYRRQWAGFEGAPVTQMMSVHAPVGSRKIGLGALLYNDRIGVSSETGFFTNYAYRIPFKQGKLALGLGAGVTLLQARWADVALQDGSDASFASNSTGTVRPNFSTGAYYYNKKLFIGASLPFFLARRYDADQDTWIVTNDASQYQPMITGGCLIPLDRDFKLKPSALVRYQVGARPQADLNCNVIFRDKVWAGLSYRTNDAVVGMLEVLPTPQWRFGYAYDLGVSDLRTHHSGSHELMLQYEFGYRIRVRDPRYYF